MNAGDHPDWSPDGRWILFRSNANGDFLNSQLYLSHPSGGGLRPVTRVSADTLLLSASFSPDGARIVYSQSGDSDQPDIFTMGLDGTHVRQVTHTPSGTARRTGVATLAHRTWPLGSLRLFLGG